MPITRPREDLKLSDTRAVASRVPSPDAVIRIAISGPQAGSWAVEHQHEDLTPFGFFIAGGGPQFTVRCADRRAYGPTQLDGSLELGLVVDSSAFANSFEAVQVAIEHLARLPDAEHLSRASLRIEVE